MNDASAGIGQRLSALVNNLPRDEQRLIELCFGLVDGNPHDLPAAARLMGLEQSDAKAASQRAISTLQAYEFSIRWEVESALGAGDEGAERYGQSTLRDALASCDATADHPEAWLSLLVHALPRSVDWSKEPSIGDDRVSPFMRTLVGVWQTLPSSHQQAIAVRYGLVTDIPRFEDRVGYLTDGEIRWSWQIEADFAWVVAAYDAAFRWAIEAAIGREGSTGGEDRAALIRLLKMSSTTSAHPERWLDLFASVSPAIARRGGSTVRKTIRQPDEWSADEPLIAALFWTLQQVTDRERLVLVLRYGLDGADVQPVVRQSGRQRSGGRAAGGNTFRTLEQVGGELDITRERVRQIEAKAVKKLTHPSRVRALKNAVEQQLSQQDTVARRYARPHLANVLSRWPDAFPHPDRWLALLTTILPHWEPLQPPEVVLADGRKHLQHLLREHGGSISRSEFVRYLSEHSYTTAVADETWRVLRQVEHGYFWTDHAVLVPKYVEIARFVLRDAGEPLHWKKVYERALRLGLNRELNTSAMYNAILANDHIFVYRGPGTYGLREWGLERRAYQKDVIADWFRRSGRNARPAQIVADLRGTEDEIGDASVAWHLHDHPLFFEDLDGFYGLREWLPPPDEQRLDTPRRLRESKRSRERRGPDSGR